MFAKYNIEPFTPEGCTCKTICKCVAPFIGNGASLTSLGKTGAQDVLESGYVYNHLSASDVKSTYNGKTREINTTIDMNKVEGKWVTDFKWKAKFTKQFDQATFQTTVNSNGSVKQVIDWGFKNSWVKFLSSYICYSASWKNDQTQFDQGAGVTIAFPNWFSQIEFKNLQLSEKFKYGKGPFTWASFSSFNVATKSLTFNFLTGFKQGPYGAWLSHTTINPNAYQVGNVGLQFRYDFNDCCSLATSLS